MFDCFEGADGSLVKKRVLTSEKTRFSSEISRHLSDRSLLCQANKADVLITNIIRLKRKTVMKQEVQDEPEPLI